MKENIINQIMSYKFQLVINKGLYKDEVISKEAYEIVENNLLDKINILSDKLEMSSTINENELEKVFDELKTEIEHIFGSKPIKTFCDKEHIKLMAIAEKSAVMEQLTNKNLEVLYTS